MAKNIKIDMEYGNSILIHMAMTGQVLLRQKSHKPDMFMRVLFMLENEGSDLHMRFCDMRMFGKVVLADSQALANLALKYGPEPLDRNFKAKEFHAKLLSKKTSIKNALLDQQIVSGLGNIYATDAQFMSGINPEVNTKELTEKQAEILLQNAKEILEEGIQHRGSTLGDKMYIDAFVNEGTHQNYFRIYNKEQCPKCNSKVEYKKINGRGTYFCPNCQPKNSTENPGLFT